MYITHAITDHVVTERFIDLAISSCCVGAATPIPILPADHPKDVGKLLPNIVLPILSVFEELFACARASLPIIILSDPVVRLDPALYPIAVLSL